MLAATASARHAMGLPVCWCHSGNSVISIVCMSTQSYVLPVHLLAKGIMLHLYL
jgi:hypothetical protein